MARRNCGNYVSCTDIKPPSPQPRQEIKDMKVKTSHLATGPYHCILPENAPRLLFWPVPITNSGWQRQSENLR
jgi:hypothetical protein